MTNTDFWVLVVTRSLTICAIAAFTVLLRPLIRVLKQGLTPKFAPSTVALGSGWFFFLGGIASGIHSVELLGLGIILGTWAYRLRKRARLGLAPRGKVTERVCLALIVLFLVSSPYVLATVEVWIFSAYWYACKAECRDEHQ